MTELWKLIVFLKKKQTDTKLPICSESFRVTCQPLFIYTNVTCKQTCVPNALSLKVHVFINNKRKHRRLPALFFNSKVFLRLFRNSLRATDLNHCHSLLLGIQSVILLSLWHRNVCKLISALSLVDRRVNHVQYSNIYGALIGGWKKKHAVFYFSVCYLLKWFIVIEST